MGSLLKCSLALLLFAASCASLSYAQRNSLSAPMVVGYFPQWALYDDEPYLVKDLLSPGGQAPLVDQINYAQGFVTNGLCSVADANSALNLTLIPRQRCNG